MARFHIYTILDMHQDVYNQIFEGEGAPDWAVCTNGVQSTDPPGRWSLEYGTRAAGIAFSHFWHNNVRGDLQGQYDQVWGDVAHAFQDRWVLGYDPFNEPFSTSLSISHGDALRRRTRVLLHGHRPHRRAAHGAPPLRCPKDDPAQGVVPTIERNDPGHLIFDEPDNYASRGFPTYIGPMDLRTLVFNVHVYCGARSPVTGNPTDVEACADQEEHSLAVRQSDRPAMASPAQPGGPAWMVTEFGASSDPRLLAPVTTALDDARSAGSTGPGSTTATPRGAPTSRSSWPTASSARRPTSSARPTRRRSRARRCGSPSRRRPTSSTWPTCRTTASVRRRSSSCRRRCITGTATAPARPGPA